MNKKHVSRCYKNLKENKLYIKGRIDSHTNEMVLASRLPPHEPNAFKDGHCFWAYKENLLNGTCYVDCESYYDNKEVHNHGNIKH